MVFFRFLDFITYSFPAALPIFFNLSYSFCLVRLRRDGIYGTECEKTIEGARIKTICFDKTGTLTHSGMRVASVFTTQGGSLAPIELASHSLMSDLFGCCNSVERINGNYEGDEIDLRMFHHAQAQIIHPPAQTTGVIRCIQVADRLIEVLRINEYESRFQSMSVLYRQGSRYFVVGKGSPEMIHLYSQTKVKGFDSFIKKLSLEGFRSIAFGCREITER
jgi:magnesium-transporting ATPase (P-type)